MKKSVIWKPPKCFQALLICVPVAGIINTSAPLPLNMKLSSAVKKIQLTGKYLLEILLGIITSSKHCLHKCYWQLYSSHHTQFLLLFVFRMCWVLTPCSCKSKSFILVLLGTTESTIIAIFDKLSISQCGKQVSLCPSPPPPLPIPSMKIARAKGTAGDHYTDRNSSVNCKRGKHVISKKTKNTLEHQDWKKHVISAPEIMLWLFFHW